MADAVFTNKALLRGVENLFLSCFQVLIVYNCFPQGIIPDPMKLSLPRQSRLFVE